MYLYLYCILPRTNSTKCSTRLLFWARAEIIPVCSKILRKHTTLSPTQFPSTFLKTSASGNAHCTDRQLTIRKKKIALRRLVYKTFTLYKKTLTSMYTDSSCTKSTLGVRASFRFSLQTTPVVYMFRSGDIESS